MRRFTAPAAVLLLAACAAQPTPRAPGATLENTQWHLTELGGRQASAGSTLRLDAAEVQARGNTGCNSFFGRYELAGQHLRFGPLASTRRACVEPAKNLQEGAFLKALGETRAWRIEGNTLVLRGEAGDLARFAAQSMK
jgi:heat shock protein HslJ